MEAFLLAPNAAAPNSMQAPAQQSTPESDTQGFTPLLDEAINHQEGKAIGTKGVAREHTEQAEETNSSQDDVLTEGLDASSIVLPDKTLISDNSSSSLMDNDAPATQEVHEAKISPGALLFKGAKPSLDSPLVGTTEDPQGLPLSVKRDGSLEISPLSKPEQATFVQQQSSQHPLSSITTTRQNSLTVAQENPQSTLQTFSPALQRGSEEAISSLSKSETLLQQQVQQLLREVKNNGPITIQTSAQQQSTGGQAQTEELQKLSSSPLLNSNSGGNQSQLAVTALKPEEGNRSELNRPVKAEGYRQDITEHYFSAKIGDNSNKNSKSGNQPQQSDSNQQPGGEQSKAAHQPATGGINFSLSPATSEDSLPGLQFSPTSTASNHTGVEGKFTPGAQLPVPEKEMVNQLVQRFSVNPRLQTSKLTMQLHPVELGELKVDILVKEGSIKANIVAQSQQVLETLEKNTPRLRTVLENQGFTVDSFEVTLDSNSDRQQELFQEHFSPQQQQSSFTKSSPKGTKSFDLVLEDIDQEVVPTPEKSGFNVTA